MLKLNISRGKLLSAFWIALSAACLLCGYEFVRSVAQSLYIKAYGSRNLPVVMTLGPVGTIILIYIYGLLLSALGARRAILATSVMSAAAIVACHFAIVNGSGVATGVLYVFREAYIVLLVEQVWSFINSTVRTDEGARLNGPVCGIASLGAVAGGLLVKHQAVSIGSANLLVFAAISLIPTGVFAALAYRAGGEPLPSPAEAGGKRGHLGISVLLGSDTLRRLAVLIALTQVVSAVTDLQLSRLVEQGIPDADERTKWFGGFYANLNIGSAVFQFVVAPLLLSFVSLRVIHSAIPLVHIVACGLAALKPCLSSAAAAYMAFKVLDYSVFRAAKELFYIPLSYDARYRAKEIIDAFGYRFAKGAVSFVLTWCKGLTAGSMAVYPVIGLAAALGWLPVVLGLTGKKKNAVPE